MTTVVEEKFDRFANDYYRFLALRYNLKPDLRIKVAGFSNQTWKTAIPAKLREVTENNPQFQHLALAIQSNAGGLRPEDRRQGLEAAGFTTKQAQAYSDYDALLCVNFDQPVRMENGQPYIWTLLVGHHVLHLVEILSDKNLISEPPTTHDYEAPDSLEHFNRFVAWVTLDSFIDRYVPCK